MIKTLMGSIRDYMKVAVATPLLVLGEVLCEVLIPFITANLIDAIKDGATVAEMLPTAGFLALIALTSLALGAAAGVTCSHASCGFAKYVFNREKMFKYLPGAVYAKLTDAMDNGAPLERAIADEVAAGMKRWATELGVTHYTHWFQPLTEGTAEKHDAFVEHDGKGGMMEEFSGKLLVQQEPDASSFPNGGIRNTFEARGYSAWDPSSPVFVVDDTLCIPTVFIAYTGESLDYKTPLLKALSAVGKAAVDVCRYFNPEVKKVVAYLGWEQEYFLVDEGLYAARPDLLLTGRTLMGHEASKSQQIGRAHV